jgi:hypothetical protein
VCGTDGGLLNGLGTFGCVWSDPQLKGELLPFGMGHVPGASLVMSSTRTEMCGIFASLTHLTLIIKKQCNKRWHDTLKPSIDRASGRKGKWLAAEDLKLKDAV